MVFILSKVQMVTQGILTQQINIKCTRISGTACFLVFRSVLICIIIRRGKTNIQAVGCLKLQSFTKVKREIHAGQSLHSLAPTESISHYARRIIIGRAKWRRFFQYTVTVGIQQRISIGIHGSRCHNIVKMATSCKSGISGQVCAICIVIDR